MQSRSRQLARRRRWVLLSALAVVVLYVASAPGLFEQPYFGLTLKGDRVARVVPTGPAALAGIDREDLLFAAGEERAAGNPFFRERFYSGALGDTIHAELFGPFGPKSVELVAAEKPVPARWQDAAALVTGVGFLMIGLYVGLQLETGVAVLFFALSMGFSLVLLPFAPAAPRAAVIVFSIVRTLAVFFTPPLVLHFFLLFPRPRHVILSSPSLRYWLYVPALAALPLVLYVCAAAAWFPEAPATATIMMSIERLADLSFLVFSVLALASFVVGTFRVRSRAERRRYKVVLWATLIGIAPLVVAVTVHFFWSNLWMPWERFTSVGLLLVPMGFAYAIVRHHLFDIEVIVKRSAAFSLLTASLVAIAALVYAIFGHTLESLTGQQTPWIMIVILGVIAGLFAPLRRRIEGFVDRTFYRDRYDDRRVLRELAQSLPRSLRLSSLFREVVEKLTRTLRAREAAILMPTDGEGTFVPVYISGLTVEDLPLPGLPLRIERMVRRARRPLRVVDVEESLPYGAFDADEAGLLDLFAGGVLVPLVNDGEVAAVLALGRRAGGEAYGFEDLELLHAIAGQATVGLRNAEMHTREIEQERIGHELAVAHEIQRQLLPHDEPELPGIEVSGGTSPCHELGGDFYDYLAFDDERTGLAVGDVSGHGVPAALVMASLSGTLRSEAMRERDPGRLMERLNVRACEAMEPGQFLSLFYGVLDPASRSIVYANAGHPPPLVIDPDGRVVQLTTGGLLLGVDPRATYATASMTLTPGSTMLLFSDGLVEAQRDEMEFGEERVIALVTQTERTSASSIRREILDEAASFVDGELQDDVTLIVLRVAGETADEAPSSVVAGSEPVSN